MSTRGFFGFRIDGKDKITYNHGNSHPDCLGDRVVDWAHAAFSPNRYEATKASVISMELVEDGLATSEHIQKVGERFTCMSVGGGDGIKDTDITYYRLLRGAMPYEGIQRVLQAGVMLKFDDPDVDYGYVIDLDYGVVEFYDWYDTRPSNFPEKSRYKHMVLRGKYQIVDVENWRKTWKKECWPHMYDVAEDGEDQ